MKPDYFGPTVPSAEGGLLSAWKPWGWSGAAINLLSEPYFEADSPFWSVHYYAAINFIVSSIETLKNVDKNRWKNENPESFTGYSSERRMRHDSRFYDPIQDFVEFERNPMHHQSKTAVEVREVSTRPFIWDGDKSQVRHGRALSWSEEGEDPLRLLALAFHQHEEDLLVIDQAIFECFRGNPFSNRHVRQRLEGDARRRIKRTGLDFYS